MKDYWLIVEEYRDEYRHCVDHDGLIVANTRQEAMEILKKYVQAHHGDEYQQVCDNFVCDGEKEGSIIDYYLEIVDVINEEE